MFPNIDIRGADEQRTPEVTTSPTAAPEPSGDLDPFDMYNDGRSDEDLYADMQGYFTGDFSGSDNFNTNISLDDVVDNTASSSSKRKKKVTELTPEEQLQFEEFKRTKAEGVKARRELLEGLKKESKEAKAVLDEVIKKHNTGNSFRLDETSEEFREMILAGDVSGIISSIISDMDEITQDTKVSKEESEVASDIIIALYLFSENNKECL
jgi:hypothetical protein